MGKGGGWTLQGKFETSGLSDLVHLSALEGS